jgi:hypothetical protein
MRTQPILTAGVMAVAFGAAALAASYKDPQQRFEIDIPAGWTAEPFGEGVKIGRGAAYCLVMEGRAPDPETLVKHLAGQFGSQWTRFQQLKQGSLTLGGRPAPYSFHSGVNPKGAPSFLKVLAVSSRGPLFGLIESSPEKELPAAKAGFEQIEQGFRLGPGEAPARTGGGYRPPQQALHVPQVGGPFVGIGIDYRQQAQGAVVGAVAPGGPAEKAGIRAGDLIVSINHRAVSDSSGMSAGLAGAKPGDTLEFGIVCGGRQSVVRVTVGVFQGQ